MGKKHYFSGIILIGFGLYFYLQHLDIVQFEQLTDWPSLLIIVGFALLSQGYLGKESEMIFPGVVLLGFGVHFYVIEYLKIWPDHIGVFLLIISLGLLLKHQKTGNGLSQGLLFLIMAVGLLFEDRILDWFGFIEDKAQSVWQYWPIFLIVFGMFSLYSGKKS